MTIELKVRTAPIHSKSKESEAGEKNSQVQSSSVTGPELSAATATDLKPYAAALTSHVL